MKIFKKSVAFLTAMLILIPFLSLFVSAEGEEAELWLFIDGENINRQVNTAVIYNQGGTTGQDRWGHNIIVDGNNTVTEIIPAGNTAGADCAIPEGGWVVSASGTSAEWLTANIKVGDALYYDRYSQRLFKLDENGAFDPYFIRSFGVQKYGYGYIITGEGESFDAEYLYGILVDAQGKIIDRGGNIDESKGTALYAADRKGRSLLIMYGLLGGECKFGDDTVTLQYNDSMLTGGLLTAVTQAVSDLNDAKAEYKNIDYSALQKIIDESQSVLNGKLSPEGLPLPLEYTDIANALYALEREFYSAIGENPKTELRGAFHTPAETNEDQVRSVVRSAKAAGINTLVLRISNGYESCIPLPESFKFGQAEIFGGFDVLKAYVDICKNQNMALAVSIDVYYNENAYAAEPSWLSVTNTEDENSMVANEYFSPYSEEFKQYFIEYVKYILDNYDIDTVMFDHLRFPKFSETADLGYDYRVLENFAFNNGIEFEEARRIKTLLTQSPHWQLWQDYRTGIIDSMAASISRTVRSIDGDITLLAVAENNGELYLQNSKKWISEGLFDGLCAAMYKSAGSDSGDIHINSYYDGMVSRQGQLFADSTGSSAYLFLGLESSQLNSGDIMAKAVNEGRAIGAEGFIFSSLNDFFAQNYDNALADNVLKGSAYSPVGDSVKAMNGILEQLQTKLDEIILMNGGCDGVAFNTAANAINEALLALENGSFTPETALSLEQEMTICFAESPAKSVIMKDFKELTKLAKLSEVKQAVTPPAEDDDNSAPPSQDVSDTPSIDQSTATPIPEGTAPTLPPQQNTSSGGSKFSLDIDMSSLLIYGIVGITAVITAAAVIVGIRRKRDIPRNHHMPKGSKKGYGQEKDK